MFISTLWCLRSNNVGNLDRSVQHLSVTGINLECMCQLLWLCFVNHRNVYNSDLEFVMYDMKKKTLQPHKQRHGAYSAPTVYSNTIPGPPVALDTRWSAPTHSSMSTTLQCTQLSTSLNSGSSAHPCHNLLWPTSIPPTSNTTRVSHLGVRNFELQSVNAVGLSQSFQDQQLTFQTKEESRTRTRNYKARQLYSCNSE